MKALGEILCDWDGKSVDFINEVRSRFENQHNYIDDLLLLCQHSETEVAASWLLKAAFEDGLEFEPEQSDRLIATGIGFVHWEAQLHLCQSLRYLSITDESAESLRDWLSEMLRHKRPFLRAWSLDGVVHLAKQSVAFEKPARVALANAELDPAASVRARARNLKSV